MGYKGVSFPFQLNNKGGILLSDTSAENPEHLSQGLIQLLSTRRNERIMEVEYFTDLEQTLFENDESARTMAVDIITESVSEHMDERLAVDEDDIEIEFTENGMEVNITYEAEDLGIVETVPITIGGVASE